MPQKFVVIIAGGRGERFWPLSRVSRPKHLISIVDETPMLAKTIERVKSIVPLANTFVITSAQQEKAVREVCCSLPAANIIAEPVGRDTAPAVALAAVLVAHRDPEGIFAVLPSDHVIHDKRSYQADLRAAFAAAEAEGVMVTIGIHPDEPATGFGYIQRGTAWKTIRRRPFYYARRFVEKPNLETAKRYLASGDYFWNAGMFVWRVGVVQAALRKHAPELYDGLQPVSLALAKGRALGPVLRKVYPHFTRISVDYALLEKSDNVVVVPASFDWDDVGAWPAVAKHLPQDAQGNAVRGTALVEQSGNNILFSEGGHLLAVIGIDDLIVVHTPDATLVCPKSRAQDLKALLKRIETRPGSKRFL
ncbi:MAG: sugar phosphate nucleotidyltransferase [Opitutaceae bacterium]